MKNTKYGFLLEDKEVKIFFTNRTVDAKNINSLKKIINYYDFNSENLEYTNQVHSTNIKIIGENNNLLENDALITNKENMPLMIFTADCVPLVFYDLEKKVIALAHSGWKGTLNNIAKNVILKFKEIYSSKLENIKVVIGPHITVENYEVSKEIIDKFSKLNINNFYRENNGKLFLNLYEINKELLIREGICVENIYNTNFCTVSDNNYFYSYRKDNKTTKRIGTLIELRR